MRFGILFTLFLSLSGLASPLLASDSPGFSVSVSVSPAPSDASTFVCDAEIAELLWGEVLANAQLTLKKGEGGRFITDPKPFSMRFEAAMDETGTKVTYTVTYGANEEVLTVKKGCITIKNESVSTP